MDLMTIVNSVSPSFESIKDEVEELRKDHPKKSNLELSNLLGKRIRNKYTSVGVASALPSVIPGFGTAAQIAIEASTISADLALMIRWMSNVTIGVALIYGKDIEKEHNIELIKILGIWCGVVKSAKTAAIKVTTKVAVVQFNKNVSGKVLMKINQRVGTTIVTKYGAKRGGIALGKLIPFGVGAVIGGSFNFFTMKAFNKAAINHYSSDLEYFIEIEDES